MYSRYIPKPGGGYDRRLVQDPPRPNSSSPVGPDVPNGPITPPVGAVIGRPPTAPGSSQQASGAVPPGLRPPPVGAVIGRPPGSPGSSQQVPGIGSPGPPWPPQPPGPTARPPGPGKGPPPGPPSGPGGLLAGLLPRGLDTEDLLILAVLLLAMKQDGAPPLELLIAAAIYLMF